MIYSSKIYEYIQRFDDVYILKYFTLNDKQRLFYTWTPCLITRGLRVINIDTVADEITVSKGAALIDNVLVTLENDTTVQSTNPLASGCYVVIYYFDSEPQNYSPASLKIVTPDDPILKKINKYVFIACIENGTVSHPIKYPAGCCGLVRREFYIPGTFDKNDSFIRLDIRLTASDDKQFLNLPAVPPDYTFLEIRVNGILLKYGYDYLYHPLNLIEFTPPLRTGDIVTVIFYESLPDNIEQLDKLIEPYPALRLTYDNRYYGIISEKQFLKVLAYNCDYYKHYPFDNFNFTLKDKLLPNTYYNLNFNGSKVKLFGVKVPLYINLNPALFIVDYTQRVHKKLEVVNGKITYQEVLW